MIFIDEKDLKLVIINALAFVATWVKVPLLFVLTSITSIQLRDEIEYWLRILLLIVTVLYTLKKLLTKDEK